MATPSGHLYCKECIVEYLLAKTQELKRQREAFEAQEKNQGVGVGVSGWVGVDVYVCVCCRLCDTAACILSVCVILRVLSSYL